MWPWEHLAVGYVLVSLWRRARSGRSPSDAEAVAVVVGTQFPDLIDKPLGWSTTLLPAGHSLAHSLVFALPVSLFAYLVGRRFGRGDVGAAFAIGYLAHLPADALYPLALGGDPVWGFVLWPLVPVPASPPVAFTDRLLELVVSFVDFLGTPRGTAYVFAELALLTVALLAWQRDGWPGLPSLRRTAGA